MTCAMHSFDRDIAIEGTDRTPCIHCGCAFNDHKGGKPGDGPATRRRCPPLYGGRRGVPLAFPRTYVGEDKSQNYTEYWARIDAYWASQTTVFACNC